MGPEVPGLLRPDLDTLQLLPMILMILKMIIASMKRPLLMHPQM